MASVRRHQCAECPKAFSRPAELKRHVGNVHSNERPHVCDVCKLGFKDMCNLRRHRSTHKAEKEFQCDKCHKFFTRASALNRHKLLMHTAANETARNDDAEDRAHVCATCGLGFKHASRLRIHEKIHAAAREFQCPGCHKFLARESDFPSHQRMYCRARSAVSDTTADDALIFGDTSVENDNNAAAEPPVSEAASVEEQPQGSVGATEGECMQDDSFLGEDVDMSEDLDEWIVGSSDDATNTAVVQQPDSSDEHTYDLLHADVPQLPISDEPMLDEENASNGGAFCAVVDDVHRYRTPQSFDEDEDDASPPVEFTLVPHARISTSLDDRPTTDLASFIDLEKMFHRMSLRNPRKPMPVETLKEVFGFLPRVGLSKASLVCQGYQQLASIFDTLHHVAYLVIEPVAGGHRFGSQNHTAWPVAPVSCTMLWCEIRAQRAPCFFRPFSSVPYALAFVAEEGLLSMTYVENLIFRQRGLGDVSNPVWQELAATMKTAKVGQWVIDGLRLEAVARFGRIRTPFEAVESYQSLTIRNCPCLRIA